MKVSPGSSVLAIARLTVRTLWRSRLVGWVSAGLVAGLIALQLFVRGDGTLEGRFRLTVLYALHFTAGWIGLATLWMASASFAQEITARSLQMVVVKPVRSASLWLGKWLGLAAVQAGWLLLAGGVVVAGARWRLRPTASGTGGTPEEPVTDLWQVWQVVEAEGSDVRAEAERQLRQRLAQRPLPEGLSVQEARARWVAMLQARQWTVPPGGTRTWTFELPSRRRTDARREVVYRLSGAARYREPIMGCWTVRIEGHEVAAVPVSGQMGDRYRFPFPVQESAAARRIEVTFHNSGSSAVVFDPRHGVRLAVASGTWEGNLLRALSIVGCRLMLLAALGLTAGVCFSLPVAVFISVGVLMVAALSHGLGSGALPPVPHTHEPPASATSVRLGARIERIGSRLGEMLDAALAPLHGIDAASRVAEGRRVTADLLGRAALWALIVYPTLLGVAGAGMLAVRELGRPQAHGP